MTQGYKITFRGKKIPAEPIELLSKVSECLQKMYDDDKDYEKLIVEKTY